MKFKVDGSTYASTPGQIRIYSNKYLDYVESKGIKRFIYSLLMKLPNFVLFVFFINNKTIQDWIEKKEQFKYGCANPTVIVNAEKGYIASFTNLTSIGKKPTPVIKITQEKLSTIKGVKLFNGQKFSSVALYCRNQDDPNALAWADFFPIIPNCLTDNIEDCEYIIKRISENAWKCLYLGLAQISNKEQIGLYPVDLDKDLVNSAY